MEVSCQHPRLGPTVHLRTCAPDQKSTLRVGGCPRCPSRQDKINTDVLDNTNSYLDCRLTIDFVNVAQVVVQRVETGRVRTLLSLRGRWGAPKWYVSFFLMKKWYVVFFASSSVIIAFVATRQLTPLERWRAGRLFHRGIRMHAGGRRVMRARLVFWGPPPTPTPASSYRTTTTSIWRMFHLPPAVPVS